MAMSWVLLFGLVASSSFHAGQCVKRTVDAPSKSNKSKSWGWANKWGPSVDDPCKCIKWGTLYNKRFMGGLSCEGGVAGLDAQEACPFFSNFHSNMCLKEEIGSGKNQNYCIVTKACPGSVPIEGSFWAKKICNTKTGDAALMDMTFTKLRRLSADHRVDLSTVTSFATRHIDKLVNETSRKEIDAIKATGLATLISSKRDMTGQKLHIRGNQVWKHAYNHADENSVGTLWELTCVEGCKDKDKHLKTTSFNDCECMNWKDVFSRSGEEGGMECGAYMPSVLVTEEFCTVMKSLDTNMCLHNYQSSNDALETPHCLVKASCATAKSPAHSQQIWAERSCKKDEVWMSKLSVAKLAEMATTSHVDMSVFLGFGAAYVDKLIEDISPGELLDMKESHVPIFVWPGKDYYEDRIFIKDGEVHTLTFNPEGPTQWDMTCNEGCPEEKPEKA